MSKIYHNKRVILVNGIPASGKSSIASSISESLGLPYLVLDSLKEPFMMLHPDISREKNRELGAAAYEALWKIIENSPKECTYVVDAWFGFQSREVLVEYINKSNVSEILEIWNDISSEVVCERYKKRINFRSSGHPGIEYLPELDLLARRAKPMNIGKTLIINQDTNIEIENVYNWLKKNLQKKV